MDRLHKAREFTGMLLRLARLYRREIDREFAAFGIADARALAILYIARNGDGVRQGVLAEALGVEGPSMTRQIDLLCLEGFVERRNDPRDGRVKTLHLTKSGRALATRIDDVGDALRADILADVNERDLATALRVFGALRTALETRQSRPKDHGALA